MKKLAVLFTVLVLCFVISACGQSNVDSKKYIQLSSLDLQQCVSSVSYKGLHADKSDSELSDAELELGLAAFLSDNAETVQITNRTVKDGDIINLSYEATSGDTVIKDFWQDNTDLKVGSNSTFEAFESSLLGKTCGEAYTVELVLPESISSSYGGKAVTVIFQINYILEKSISPLTDEYVKSLTDWGCSTVEEFRTVYRAHLQQLKSSYCDAQYNDTLWSQVMDSAVISSYGQKYIASFCQRKQDECVNSAASSGLSNDDFAKSNGYNDSASLFEAVNSAAEAQAKTALVMYYIAEKEGLNYTDEEYYSSVDKYASYLGYETTNDMINALGIDYIEETVGDSLIYNLVKSYVAENAA